MPFSNCINLGHLMAIWAHVIQNDDEKKLSGRTLEVKTVIQWKKIVFWEDWCWRRCYIVAPERRNDQMFLFFVTLVSALPLHGVNLRSLPKHKAS